MGEKLKKKTKTKTKTPDRPPGTSPDPRPSACLLLYLLSAALERRAFRIPSLFPLSTAVDPAAWGVSCDL
jgi:hypothetical protein